MPAAAALRYDPYDPAVIVDPAPVYRRLRDEDPVHRLPTVSPHGAAVWAISRFDDVWRCFADPDSFSNAGGITGSQLLEGRIAPFAALGNLDDPLHRERRSAVKGHFTPARVGELRERCVTVCADALAPLREGGEIDLVVDLGLRLSGAVVADLLAIPAADESLVTAWVRDIFFRRPDEHGLSARGMAAYAELSRYCVGLATDARRGRANSPLLGAYIAAATEGRLSDDDLGSHLREIVIGGAETNPRALAATVRRLADAPDQRAEVVGDPTLAAAAFLEGVRIDTPGQFIGRTLGRDVELHGRTLSRGDVALLLIASANRDEREFAAPDDYDIHRTPRRALGFGHGAHFCVGRHVAVLESEVAIQQLLAIAPEFVVDAARSTRSHHEMVHGYTSLPVRAA